MCVCQLPSKTGGLSLLSSLFEWLVPPCLYFVQNPGSCKQLCPVTDIELVCSITRLLDCLFAPIVRKDIDVKEPEMPKFVETAFLMALMWSIGEGARAALLPRASAT
jgi:hypothetical protein